MKFTCDNEQSVDDKQHSKSTITNNLTFVNESNNTSDSINGD